MRAIRINPYDRTVSEVETSGRAEGQGDALPGLYALLSDPAHMVELFTVLSLDAGEGETLYLDDEGLLSPGRAVWRLKDYPSPLCGVGLILGTDDEGDSIGTALTLQFAKSLVTWSEEETTGDLTAGRDATPEEARAMSHGLADFGFIGGGPILQPRGMHAGGQDAKRAEDQRDHEDRASHHQEHD